MAQQDITSPISFGGGYLKRFGTQLGFNSQPSTLDLEFVIDDQNGQYFDSEHIVPGNISGISAGNFTFFGLIQSWQYNYGSNGFTYNTKIVDPRILFSEIRLIIDGIGPLLPTTGNLALGSGVYNLINVYNYYGNDQAADYTRNGMSWNKIKQSLSNGEFINLFGKKFRLSFDDGFVAPDFLRLNQNNASLEDVLQEVAIKLGVDFFVEIDPSYNPSREYNIINVKTISRKNQESRESIEIDNFITEKKNDGTLISYQRGQELRTGATAVVLEGDLQSFLYTTTDFVQCWGKTGLGFMVTSAGTTYSALNAQEATASKDEFGFVLLENISSDDPKVLMNLPFVDYEGRQRYRGGNNYPPSIIVTNITNSIKGYRPSENTLRAALFSREAWEAILWKDHPAIARAFGIDSWILHDFNSEAIIRKVEKYKEKFYIYNIDQASLKRTPEQAALLQIIYELTREAAEKYYGKTFLAALPLDTSRLVESSINSATINTRYGYQVIDSVYDSSIPLEIFKSPNSNFLDSNGRCRGYITLQNVKNPDGTFQKIRWTHNENGVQVYSDPTLGTTDEPKIDISLLSNSDYIIDNKDIYVACEIQQDPTNLARAIITLPAPIQYKNFIKDPEYPVAFVSFLRALGAQEKAIFTGFKKGERLNAITWNSDVQDIIAQEDIPPLINFAKFYPELGLAPKRYTSLSTCKIPLQNNFLRYGPYIKTSNNIGGVAYIRDESINPETFNSYERMNEVGNELAANALTAVSVMDFGNLSLAGLPVFNIGDKLGMNSNITSISMNFGTDGLITSYNLQTFALPPFRLSRILNEKVIKFNIDLNKTQQSLIKLEDKAKELINNKTEKDGYYNIVRPTNTATDPFNPNKDGRTPNTIFLSQGLPR